MPIAHVCSACGDSLAFVRAVPDPHYALPIVVCQRCSKACVRRQHPTRKLWNDTLRSVTAGWTALLQIALIAGACFVTMLATTAGTLVAVELLPEQPAMFEALDMPRMHRHPREQVLILFALWGIAPIAVGTWLTAAFGHIKPLRRWAFWWLLLPILGSIAYAIFRFLVLPARFEHAQIAAPNGLTTGEFLSTLTGYWLVWLAAFAVFNCIAIAGIGPGLLLRKFHAAFARTRFRARRRARRSARSEQ